MEQGDLIKGIDILYKLYRELMNTGEGGLSNLVLEKLKKLLNQI